MSNYTGNPEHLIGKYLLLNDVPSGSINRSVRYPSNIDERHVSHLGNKGAYWEVMWAPFDVFKVLKVKRRL